jgi:hypothetical protein
MAFRESESTTPLYAVPVTKSKGINELLAVVDVTQIGILFLGHKA